LLDKIVAYTAENERANFLMADAFEQLGYQQESMAARNWFLVAAQELRSDDLLPQAVDTAGPDVLRAIPAGLMMDVFATRIVPERSVDAGRIAFVMKLGGKSFGVEVEDGVLNSFPDHTPADSMGTVTAENAAIFAVLAGRTSLVDAISNGSIEVSDSDFFKNFLSLLDDEIPSRFNLVQPRLGGN
jgi:alkyl sulfatase BDS1-like metallo-beta-lactamase superfamily hydrolase